MAQTAMSAQLTKNIVVYGTAVASGEKEDQLI
jgi:hypothetical protein